MLLVNVVLFVFKTSDDKRSLLVLNEGLLDRLKDLWSMYKKSEINFKEKDELATTNDEEEQPDPLEEGREELQLNFMDEEESVQSKRDDDSSNLSSSRSCFSKVCLL